MRDWIQLTCPNGVPFTVAVDDVVMFIPVSLTSGPFHNVPNPGIVPACDVLVRGLPKFQHVSETYDQVRALVGIRL